MRVRLEHKATGGSFVAVSQRQIDRLTDPEREGGAWTVTATGSDALAQSHTAAELRDMAAEAGIDVPKSATKAQLAALLDTGGATAGPDTDTEV